MNENVDRDMEHDFNVDKIPPENIDNILNSSITEDEIQAVVTKLKINKASGYHNILTYNKYNSLYGDYILQTI